MKLKEAAHKVNEISGINNKTEATNHVTKAATAKQSLVFASWLDFRVMNIPRIDMSIIPAPIQLPVNVFTAASQLPKSVVFNAVKFDGVIGTIIPPAPIFLRLAELPKLFP